MSDAIRIPATLAIYDGGVRSEIAITPDIAQQIVTMAQGVTDVKAMSELHRALGDNEKLRKLLREAALVIMQCRKTYVSPSSPDRKWGIEEDIDAALNNPLTP